MTLNGKTGAVDFAFKCNFDVEQLPVKLSTFISKRY